MSLFSDHDCKLDGQFVNYFKNAGNSVNLNPGQDLTVSLPIVRGTLTAFVESAATAGTRHELADARTPAQPPSRGNLTSAFLRRL